MMFKRLRFFLVIFTLALALSALTVGSVFAGKPGGVVAAARPEPPL